MTTNLQSALHDLAVKFSQESGLRPVSMIEAAMTQAAAFAMAATTECFHDAIDEVVKIRETANRNNKLVCYADLSGGD